MSDIVLLRPGRSLGMVPLAAPPGRHQAPRGGALAALGLSGPDGAPVKRPRARLASLGVAIEGPVPLPGAYPPGTAGFRYWATAEALERVARLWRTAVEWPWQWRGGVLRVALVAGPARAVMVERGRLVVGHGAAPSAVMRGLGHAVLDALRPALWDLAAGEAEALHAGFADAAVQLAALDGPGGEEGIALAPGLAGTGFGRAFAEVLAVLARPSGLARRKVDAGLVALRGARLLATAVRRVSLAPDLLAQVASEMALAAQVLEGPLVALQLRDVFARHFLLPRSPVLEGYDPHVAADGAELPCMDMPVAWVALDAASLGFDRPLLVSPAAQLPKLCALNPAPAPLAAARAFVEQLDSLGLMERPRIGRYRRRVPGTNRWATHLLEDDGRALRLVRERFVVGRAIPSQALSVQPASGSIG